MNPVDLAMIVNQAKMNWRRKQAFSLFAATLNSIV